MNLYNISDALPIQFWDIANNTFNEDTVGFVDSIPYGHWWQNDDNIKLQVAYGVNPTIDSFNLKVTDPDGAELADIPFVETDYTGPDIVPILSVNNSDFIGSLAPWTQDEAPFAGFGIAWNWLANSSIKADGTAGALNSTKYLRTVRADGYISGWPIGHYGIQLGSVTNHSTGAGAAGMVFEFSASDDGGITNTVLYTSGPVFAIGVPTGVFITIDTTKYWKSFAIRFYNPGTAVTILNATTFRLPTSFAGTPYPPRNETLARYDLNFDKASLFTQQIQNGGFIGTLAPNSGFGGGSALYIWIADGNIEANAAIFRAEPLRLVAPKYLKKWAAGTYALRVQGNNFSSGGVSQTIAVTLYGNDTDVLADNVQIGIQTPIAVGNFDFTLIFTLDRTYTELVLFVARLDVAAPNIKVKLFNINIDAYNSNADDLPYPWLRFYIQRNVVDVAKSDKHQFFASVPLNQSYGTKVAEYLSSKNYAGINYPNDGNPFTLRIPCRFFQRRPKIVQDALELTGSTVITGSTKGRQQLMETVYLPDYMHEKIQLILEHAVSGNVTIDGKVWILEESYDLTSPDPKSPMQMAKIWLTDKLYLIRNII